MSELKFAVELLAAVMFAADRHKNQRRKDAEASPYINHPIALAQLLATTGGVYAAEQHLVCSAVLDPA